MDRVKVQVMVKFPYYFFMRVAINEIIDIHSVLPDLAARWSGCPLINVSATSCESHIKTSL